MFMESWIIWVSCKVNVKPYGLHLLWKRPEVFIIPWTLQKLNSFLKYTFFVYRTSQTANTTTIIRPTNTENPTKPHTQNPVWW